MMTFTMKTAMTSPSTQHTSAQQRLLDFYTTISPNSLNRIFEIYAAEARFKDPFNDVKNPAQIRKIFEHMFESLNKPQFTILQCIAQDNQCFILWDLTFYFKNTQPDTRQTIHGGSHVIFNEEGMVSYHRDYWDAAEELYEKFPLLGSLLRWIKRRLCVH